MLFYSYPSGLGWLFLLLGTHLTALVAGHAVWLQRLWRRLNRPAPSALGMVAVLLAAVTPVIGFYAVSLTDRLTGAAPAGPRPAWWRLALPVLSALILFHTAWRLDQRYLPEYRSMAAVWEDFGMLCLAFLTLASVAHMAARVFGWSRVPWMTSRSQLVTLALICLSSA